MDPGVDRPGPVPLAVAVTGAATPGGASARLVVFGDADFATDQLFGFQGNGDLALNAVSWLAEDEQLISIRPREAGYNPIALTESQAGWVFWVTVVLLPLAVALAGMLIVSRIGRWSLKDLAAAGAGIVLSLGVVALLNFLGGRYHHRLDLTKDKINTLDRQTVKVLDSAEKAGAYVHVKAFMDEMQRYPAESLLSEYRYQSGGFDFDIVDPQKNALAVKQHDIRQSGTSIVEVRAAGAVRTQRVEETTEEALSNAIRRALEAKDRRVCFTSGHGEGELGQTEPTGFSTLRSRLGQTNLEVVERFRLGADELRPGSDVLAILGPKTPFAAAETAALRSHLDHGGAVLVMLDPATRSGLEPLLDEYGVAVGDNFVVDLSGLGQVIGADVSVPVVLNYGTHAITEKIGQGVMSFFPLARSVAAGGARSHDPQVTPLTLTHRSSWGESDLSPIAGGGGQVRFDEGLDTRGPLSLAVAATVKADTSLGGPERARLVVFGDTDFATNRYFDQQANGQLLAEAVGWLGEGEAKLDIPARQAGFNPINLYGNAGTVVLWVSVFILPFAVALSGLVMTLRRGYVGSAQGLVSWLVYTFAGNAVFHFVAGVVRLSEARALPAAGLLALAMVGVAVAYGMNIRARWSWAPALLVAVVSAAAGFWFIPHATIKLVYAAVFVVNAAILAWVRGAFDESRV